MLLAVLSALLAGGVVASQAGDEPAPVEVRALAVPQPLDTSDGVRHVAYELLITSYHGDTGPLRLVHVEVSGDGPAPLEILDDEALATRLVFPGRATGAADREARAIGAGEHALLYLWVRLPASAPPPRVLRHRLVFRSQTGRSRTVEGVPVPIASAAPPVLGPPFRGGTWLAHEGPGEHRSHHWGSQLARNGRVTVPQRFAIDFLGLDGEGRAVRADVRTPSNDNWIGFGAEVIAVEDGVVRDAQEGVPDNPPLAPPRPPASITARALYGNFVVTEGHGHFVHYAHLQQGSVRVRAGQRIRRGDPIGRVGNSGNTTGPHLHLHVSDRATFEESDGRPFVFALVEVLGHTTVDRVLDRQAGPVGVAGTGVHRRALPLHGTVLRFDRARPVAGDDAAAGRIDRARPSR